MKTTVRAAQKALEVIVSFDGAVQGVHHLRLGESLRLGPAVQESLVSDGPSKNRQAPDYALCDLVTEITVASHGPVMMVAFPEWAAGEVVLADGKSRSLAALVEGGLCERMGAVCRYALPDEAKAHLSIASLEIQIQSVMLQEQNVPRPLPIDWRAQRFVAVSLLANAGLVALALLAPPDPHALASTDLSRLDNAALRTRFVPAQVEFKLPDTKAAEPSKDNSGKAVKDAIGRAGDRNKVKKTITTIEKPVEGPTRRNGQDLRAEVQNAGILSIFGAKQTQGAMAKLLDRDTSALGQDADAVLQGLVATTGDVGWGTNGSNLVSTGTGPGGGCTGPDCGTIAAAFERVCQGANCGNGPGGPGGKGPIGKLAPLRHKPEGPTLTLTPPVVSEGIDKETIRRVIRSHMNEFKFCYEQQLVRAPELAGRVVVSFLIGKDGRVISAATKESTMNNGQVHGCLSKAVERLSFPRPDGANLVQVSYPFLFQTAGR